ncbi:MAG TPA: lamin tail domain-containing protein, partial [Polyangiaceae bacterium]|nr:lamin tail domain-containing protein [Polyangiaceae bacterium]
MRNFLSVVALGVLGAVACSSSSEPESAPASEPSAGSLALSLKTGSGVSLTSVKYLITGPGNFSREAVVNVGSSNKLSTLIGALPIGSGFSISLSSAAADGSLTCTGSANFNVVARATSAVTVHLQCIEAARTGSVLVNGDLNVCAAIDGLGASPASATVGGQLALSATAHDTDALPQALSYSWTASAGTLSSASAKDTTLTCTGAGEVTITLKVSDGDCGETQVATVSCTAPDAPPGVARVVVNEVESNGGTPGDWVELYNAGTATADLSGWKFKDNDDSHAFYIVPAGTLLAPGAYYVLEEAQFGFGLGG